MVNRALPCLEIRRNRALEMTASNAQPSSLSVGMQIALTSMPSSKTCLVKNRASVEVGHMELSRCTLAFHVLFFLSLA